MTALIQDRVTTFAGRLPNRGSPSIAANVLIFKDALVCLDVNGRAVPGGTIASGALFGVGKASQQYDNRTVSAAFVPLSGLADACTVQVEYGTFGWENSGAGADFISNANVGQVAYVVDDQTVALTSAGGTRGPAGVIAEVRDGQVYVTSSPDIAGALAQDVQTPSIATFRARNVVLAQTSLAAYTVAANAAVNDNILNVAGDIVLLIAQTAPAENGLYVVGTVGAGTAPLTRLLGPPGAGMPAGLVFAANALEVAVAAGDVFGNTYWFNSAAGVIGTNTQGFVPESVTISQALVAGTMTITSVPILSATKSSVSPYRKIANTCTATTGGYVTNGAATPGALGTASVAVMAAVAAGTINNADISTVSVTIDNG